MRTSKISTDRLSNRCFALKSEYDRLFDEREQEELQQQKAQMQKGLLFLSFSLFLGSVPCVSEKSFLSDLFFSPPPLFLHSEKPPPSCGPIGGVQ